MRLTRTGSSQGNKGLEVESQQGFLKYPHYLHARQPGLVLCLCDIFHSGQSFCLYFGLHSLTVNYRSHLTDEET